MLQWCPLKVIRRKVKPWFIGFEAMRKRSRIIKFIQMIIKLCSHKCLHKSVIRKTSKKSQELMFISFLVNFEIMS